MTGEITGEARDACMFCCERTEIISVRFFFRCAKVVMTCPNCALVSSPDEHSSSMPIPSLGWVAVTKRWQSLRLSGRARLRN
jgi:hypothetical protein